MKINSEYSFITILVTNPFRPAPNPVSTQDARTRRCKEFQPRTNADGHRFQEFKCAENSKGFNIWSALKRFGGRRAEDCPPYHRVACRARTPVRAAAGPRRIH